MKLSRTLEHLNSFEKNSFLKVLDTLAFSNAKKQKEIESLLNKNEFKDIKTADNLNVSAVFNLVNQEFQDHIKDEFQNASSQLDILIDILIRDGNCIMKQDWFSRLYEKEIAAISKRVKILKKSIETGSTELSPQRLRDYKIYMACLNTAYQNDLSNNQEPRITADELSILVELANVLGLSQEEVKLINYCVLPISKHDIDTVINELKNIGVVFYSKKTSTLYVADEIVQSLRKVRGKQIADKHYRSVLNQIREPLINVACRNHGIDWKQPIEAKLKAIVQDGLGFIQLMSEDIFREETNQTDRKKEINSICESGLNLEIKGVTLQDKITNLISYFNDLEMDERIGISLDGYEQLLTDLNDSIPKLNSNVRTEFELQEEFVLTAGFLMDLNIKPRDIIELLPKDELLTFCKNYGVKSRGNLFENVLEAYKDSENLFLENYSHIAFRDLNQLKENGLRIKEAELGVKFETLTKKIFELLGFNVDEPLRQKINTTKDKMDIVLRVSDKEIILIECKTNKESGYNKFSAVSRQLKSYMDLAHKNEFRVIKSLLIAPDFSDEFINDCELEYDLNLSLIKASSLYSILLGFKVSKLTVLPYKLLMRDVVIQDERVLKSISK